MVFYIPMYILITLIIFLTVFCIYLYIKNRKAIIKHLKEYHDVAPESSVYNPKQKKKKSSKK